MPIAAPSIAAPSIAAPKPIPPTLRLRIVFGPGEMMGPGKADLLEGIARTGSIAAAGRAMAMSYKRAWMLVETMNATFRQPLVDSTRGGPKGGGAVLTAAGATVVQLYRQIEAQAVAANAAGLAELAALLADAASDIPGGK